jgi:Cof subfamily protein (haloacid dehalogenase superfamily)
MKEGIKLVATDLDGTFLRNDKSISQENLDMLHLLGERGICRVIATGRNLHKTREVISPEVPFDFIVFSSGSGVYDIKNEKQIFLQNLNSNTVQQISDFLIERDLNFHLFKPVPENHKCWFFRGSYECSEFEKYFGFHNSHSEPLPANRVLKSEACQFLIVFPNIISRFMKLKDELEAEFKDIKVVRTSSPLETGYIWMEIFHQSVSKGNGVRVICDSLNIRPQETIGVGNDFNDLDLLAFTKYSYLVENGPEELKPMFLSAKSNEESAFANAVRQHI